jgi:hypothetical protein
MVKISQMPELLSKPAAGDLVPVVDVSDTTESAAGTTKHVEYATFTGALEGTGSPEGAVTAPVGTMYINLSGGAGTTLWVKETGAGNTGWAAK